MDRWTMKSLASRRTTMILSLVFSTVALFLAAIGISGLQRALQSQLFGVAAADAVVLVAVTGLLASVAAPACAVPAWRASRIDPLVALSH